MGKKRKVDDADDRELIPDTINDLQSNLNTVNSNDSDDDDEEEIAKILAPFSKEKLIELLIFAASQSPQVIKEIHKIADQEPCQRKLFVHGLDWETTSANLKSFFSSYGEIEDCNIVIDKSTGKSKGYGFVLFKHRKDAQKALKTPQKKIDNRTTACQLASFGPVSQTQSKNHSRPNLPQSQSDGLERKIYVGNVKDEISAERLLQFFSTFGEIEEGPLGFDRKTRKSKGFALFIYKTVDGARKALVEPNKNVDGHHLYCQKATSSNKNRSVASSSGDNISTISRGTGFNAPQAGITDQVTIVPGTPMSLLTPGVFGSCLPFGQVGQPNPTALALLAAVGQNPTIFGINPTLFAPVNPSLPIGSSAATQVTMGASPSMPHAGPVSINYQPISTTYQGGSMGQFSHPNSGFGFLSGCKPQ